MVIEKAPALTYSMVQRQEETIKKGRGRLLSFIKSRVSNLEDAEDILQDMLEQLEQNEQKGLKNFLKGKTK
jgi:DNA-directed RNA polymerase specialized sigma24 family protein